jgi:glycosyltransferase involved in cell wall biosynthesis
MAVDEETEASTLNTSGAVGDRGGNSRLKTIMHLITNFTASAGAEMMLGRLLRSATAERVVVVSLMDISERNRNLADNPNIFYFALKGGSAATLAPAILRLAKLIREQQPNVIVCWMYHAMVAGTIGAHIARHPTSVYWNVRQSLDDMASLSWSSRAAILMGKWLSGAASGVIYNSLRARDLHEVYGYSSRNRTVIPNGFDLPPAAASQPRTARRLGIAGRFHPQKDHGTFFRAAASVLKTHPDATFCAAGHGLTLDNPAVVRLISEANLPFRSIDLWGEVSDMSQFYRSIDVLVLSSRTEGFPNVIAEAMSYSKPVVTTDVGDAATVVGQAGIAVPPRRPDALAAAIRTMLDLSPHAYASVAHHARMRVEREYSLATVAQRYNDFLLAAS